MKIGGPSGPAATSSGGRRTSSAGEAFAPAASGAVRGAATAASAGASTLVGGLDALLALQDIGGPLERRRRAMARGGRLLDGLDRVQLALLDGGDPREALGALAQAAGEAREGGGEAGLNDVLDQIDVRAAVELAKAERGGPLKPPAPRPLSP